MRRKPDSSRKRKFTKKESGEIKKVFSKKEMSREDYLKVRNILRSKSIDNDKSESE